GEQRTRVQPGAAAAGRRAGGGCEGGLALGEHERDALRNRRIGPSDPPLDHRATRLRKPNAELGLSPRPGRLRLGRIDIHRIQIMAAARWMKPRKWTASLS